MSGRPDKPREYFAALLDLPDAKIDYSEIPPTTPADWEDAEVLLPVSAEEFRTIKELISSRREQARVGAGPAQVPAPIDNAGHVEQGIILNGKSELLALLERWLAQSAADTIGDVGNFGRRPWIFVDLRHGRRAVLNADTKREAVEEYVRDARERGADAPWWVLPNRRGSINKLAFREDGEATPGWYCYLEPSKYSVGTI